MSDVAAALARAQELARTSNEPQVVIIKTSVDLSANTEPHSSVMVLQAAADSKPPRIVAATELDSKATEVLLVPSGPSAAEGSASNQPSVSAASAASPAQNAKGSEIAPTTTSLSVASQSAELSPSSHRPTQSVGYYSPQTQANTLRSIPSLPSLAPERVQKPPASTIPIPAAAHLVSSPSPPPMHNVYVPPSAAVGIPPGY